MKTIGPSCILFIHLHWVTSPFMMMSTDAYNMMMIIIIVMFCIEVLLTFGVQLQTTSPTMMGLEGANCLVDSCSHMWLCVGKYYTTNFVRTRGHLYDGFNSWFLIMSCMFAFPNPNNGVYYSVFLKVLKSCATSIFQIKARHPYTIDNGITNKDHGTCIG